MTMTRPEKMIVGMDAGGRSVDALRAACELSDHFQAKLYCVHVVEAPPIEDVAGRPDQLAELYAEMEAAAGNHAHGVVVGIAGAAATEGPDARIKVEVLRGHVAEELLKRAESLGADWLFLGPHEHRHAFDFGSTTRSVLGKAHGGVWVQPEAWKPIRKIVVPVDLSEDSMHALKVAADLAQALDAALTVVHCFQEPDFAYIAAPGYVGPGPLFSIEGAADAANASYTEALDAAWASGDFAGPPPERRFVRGRPVDVILGFQEEQDLIVMSSHGRSGFTGAVLGNVAYSVLKKSSIPVLSLKREKSSSAS